MLFSQFGEAVDKFHLLKAWVQPVDVCNLHVFLTIIPHLFYYMTNKKMNRRQTTIHRTIHWKLTTGAPLLLSCSDIPLRIRVRVVIKWDTKIVMTKDKPDHGQRKMEYKTTANKKLNFLSGKKSMIQVPLNINLLQVWFLLPNPNRMMTCVPRSVQGLAL